MNTTASHAAPTRFGVTIVFTDGVYTNSVRAADEARAKGLALTDARLGSPYGSFFGKVLSISAAPS